MPGSRTGRALLALVILLSLAAHAALAASSQPDEVVAGIYRDTNVFRKAQGLQAVTPTPALEATARDFAQYMARTGRYGHDADGKTPAIRVEQHGYAYCVVTENIAYQYSFRGYTTAELTQRLMQGWRTSPPHRKNLLDPDVTQTGAAVAQSAADGRYYAVQLFGRPASDMTEFQLTNEAGAVMRYAIEGRRYALAPGATGTHRRCRAAPVALLAANGEAATTVRPANGEHLVVTRSPTGGWQVHSR